MAWSSAAADATAYLSEHGIADAVHASLAAIIAERPTDPITALGEKLVAMSLAKQAADSPLGDEELRKVEKPIASQVRAKWLAKELFGLSIVDGTIKDLDSYDDRNFYFRATTQRAELCDAADGHAVADEGGAFHFVLKVHNGVESLNTGFIECQNLAMEAVRAKCEGVWCPRPLPSVEGWRISYAEQPLANKTVRRHAVRCLPFKPGKLLGDVVADAALLAELGRVCAKVTHSLADFDHPDAHRTFIWDLAQCLSVRPLLKHLDPAEPERLVLKAVLAVDRVAARAGDVAALDVLALDDPLDGRAAVAERLAALAEAVEPLHAQRVEVGGGERHLVQEEREDKPHRLLDLAVDHQVEEDLVARQVGPALVALLKDSLSVRSPVHGSGHAGVEPREGHSVGARHGAVAQASTEEYY